jgi:malate dehydrogenase
MKKTKVGIVGAGLVGATAAYSLAMLGTCSQIVLYDINTDIAIGKAIDIGQSTTYSPNGTNIIGATSPKDLSGCDIVVITAGVPRKSDMTRADR